MKETNYLKNLTARYQALQVCIPDIEKAYKILCDCFDSGGKVLLCGNGGSAADAEHWSAELLKGFYKKRAVSDEIRSKLPAYIADNLQGALPAIPLTGFISLSTAYANDVNPELIFSQLVFGLGKPGDVLIGLSTSGNSKNVINAIKTAAAMKIKTIGLTGKTGGNLAEISDVCIKVPAEHVHEIQEYHLPIYHCISMMLEERFF